MNTAEFRSVSLYHGAAGIANIQEKSAKEDLYILEYETDKHTIK